MSEICDEDLRVALRAAEEARRRAEEALREAELRNALVAMASNDAIYDWEIATGRLLWSQGLPAVFGYEHHGARLDIKWWEEQIHPDDRARVVSSLNAAIESGAAKWADEYRFRHADERYVVAADRGYFLRDATGRAVRMIGAMTDVTERRRAEGELRAQKRLFELVLECMADGVVVTDTNGKFLVFNPAARRITGVGPQADERPEAWQAAYGIFHADGTTPMPTEELPLYRAMRGEATDTELFLRNPKLPHGAYMRISGRPLRDEDGALRGGVVVFHDVTERRRLEEELRQSQKMDAIGRLAGGVAHDFNNILLVVRAHARQLEAHATEPDRVRRSAAEISKAVEVATSLTKQLLAFSRKQVLRPRMIDLDAAIAEHADLLRRLIGENVRLVLEPGARPASVKVDPGQMQQVIMNLAVNARDAMPEGGLLRIATSTACVEADDPRREGGLAPGDYVVLSVADTGIGMDAETAARAFEPFFTTKERGKGTGLGLATVYGIVKQSGGHIEVESAPGRGTTFRIYLPRAEKEAVEPAHRPVPGGPAARGSETILLAEDDEAVRSLLRDGLRASGYRVIEAARGEEALEAASREAGPLSVLVADVVMPGMGGVELARRLTEAHPHLRVIFISGYADDALSRAGLDDPRVTFLAKPFSVEALVALVRSVIDAPRP